MHELEGYLLSKELWELRVEDIKILNHALNIRSSRIISFEVKTSQRNKIYLDLKIELDTNLE